MPAHLDITILKDKFFWKTRPKKEMYFIIS